MKKSKKRIQILTNIQIENCISSGVAVEAWVFEMFDKSGQINSYNKTTIKIGDEYYMRENCMFYAEGNYFNLVH